MQAWNDFLKTQPVQPVNRQQAIGPLDHSGLLYVGGDDASDFLQQQLSNDINHCTEQRSQLSSFSNAKGRMFGIFRVIRIDGGFLLLMPQSIIPDIQQRLQKFVIRSQVVMADISDSFARFTATDVSSDTFSALFTDLNFDDDQYINQVHQTDHQIAIRLPAATGRYRVLVLNDDANEAIELWQQLAQSLPVNSSGHWQLQQIEAGIPTIYPQTSEAFVLQMSNLQLLDGVSFKKGCYPGQEVVARMQYLGKLKRQMFLASVETSTTPLPGDELTSRGSEKADGSGKVVDAVQIASNQCLMLFIAKIAETESRQLVLGKQPEANIDLLELPYTLPE